MNVRRHSIVKGTLVLTSKAVKSPSAALSLLNNAVQEPMKYVQPKFCRFVSRYRNKSAKLRLDILQRLRHSVIQQT